MTAVKYAFDIKRAFLYFSCPKKKRVSKLVELFSGQCLAIKRTLHFVAFILYPPLDAK